MKVNVGAERLDEILAQVRGLMTGQVDISVRPINDYVLVKRLPRPTESEGGIALPEKQQSAKARMQPALVLAVGPGRVHPRTGTRVPVGVEPGQIVYVWPFMMEPVSGHGTGQDALADTFIVPGLPTDLRDSRSDVAQGVERAGVVGVVEE